MRAKLIFISLTIIAAFFVLALRKSDGQEQGLYHGIVEARQYHLSFEIPGRLKSVAVKEGDHVSLGQTLAELDLAEFKNNLRLAEAEMASANARLVALRRGSRPEEIGEAKARVKRALAELERLNNGPTAGEVSVAKARKEESYRSWQLKKNGVRSEDIATAASELDAAQSRLALAQVNRQRYQALYQAGAVAASTFDQVRTREEEGIAQVQALTQQHEKAKSGFRLEEIEAAHQRYLQQQASFDELVAGPRYELISAASAEVESAQKRLDLLAAGPRIEDIEIARQSYLAAQARYALANKNFEKATLLSPAQGFIQKRNFEPGEAILPGSQVLNITDLQDSWVELFIPETELSKIFLGQEFTITSDSTAKTTFNARVIQISDRAEYTPKQIQTQQQRVFLIYRIKLAISNAAGVLKPGMPIDARTKPEAPASNTSRA